MRQHVSVFHGAIGHAGDRSDHRGNSDELLVLRVAAGNRLAMQVLFARHHARVYRFVLRLLGSQATAQDVTADVFLSVWQQAGRFQARASFSTWLLAIARNKALSELRRCRHLRHGEYDPEMADPSDGPEVTCAINRRAELLRKCLGRLSREHREIVDLVYYHERSVQEVADILDIPRSTVRTRMFYARRKLAQLLASQGVARGAL
jgi:RNA polymerase sigma-70 factor (ECF subfamily)